VLPAMLPISSNKPLPKNHPLTTIQSKYANTSSTIPRAYIDKHTQQDATIIHSLSQIEKEAITQAIEFCNGNIPKAAALLEVSPSTIYRKRQSWNKNP